jgi:hypothetical protein
VLEGKLVTLTLTRALTLILGANMQLGVSNETRVVGKKLKL